MSEIEPGTPEVSTESAPEPPAASHVTRNLVQGLIALLLVGALIVVAIVLVGQHKPGTTSGGASASIPTPKNMASGGILLTGKNGRISAVRTPAVAIGAEIPTDTAAHSHTVNIVEYLDFQCPYCLQFENTNLSKTAALVASGNATLEIHPIAILDRSSQGTRYSSRAQNAAACVANFFPDDFLNVTAALFSYQPAEGSAGLTNAQLLSVLKKADVSGPAITNCVNRETFRAWVSATTNSVVAGTFDHVASSPQKFQGTPTVFVEGELYPGSLTDSAAFGQFVVAQAGAKS